MRRETPISSAEIESILKLSPKTEPFIGNQNLAETLTKIGQLYMKEINPYSSILPRNSEELYKFISDHSPESLETLRQQMQGSERSIAGVLRNLLDVSLNGKGETTGIYYRRALAKEKKNRYGADRSGNKKRYGHIPGCP